MKKFLRMRTRPAAISFALWAIFLYLLAAALSSLKIINLSSLYSPYILVVVGLFILIDQGIWAKKKLNKPTGFINWALTVAAVILLIGVLFGLIGWSLGGLLDSVKGVVTSFLAIILLVALLTD